MKNFKLKAMHLYLVLSCVILTSCNTKKYSNKKYIEIEHEVEISSYTSGKYTICTYVWIMEGDGTPVTLEMNEIDWGFPYQVDSIKKVQLTKSKTIVKKLNALGFNER